MENKALAKIFAEAAVRNGAGHAGLVEIEPEREVVELKFNAAVEPNLNEPNEAINANELNVNGAHGVEAKLNEAFEAAFENVVVQAEPWLQPKQKWWRPDPKRKWIHKLAKAKPWKWPLWLMDAFLGAEMVRHVGPGQPPQRRYEWERKDFF